MTALNDDQRYALAQLRELTNGGDDDASISILESVGWDVQQAANLIFGGAASEAQTRTPGPSISSLPSPESPTRVETFAVDDSRQGLLEPSYGAREHQRERHAQSTSTFLVIARPILSLLAVPLHVLSSIVRFIFGLLRIPVPQFHLRFVGLNLYRNLGGSRTSRRGVEYSGPERWIRELEEETGAICMGRVKNFTNPGRGAASSAVEAGPSSIAARGAAVSPSLDELLDDGRKILPDFMLGTYEEMLNLCKKEARIGCVILVSEEHDDVPEFKRSTLTDPTFVKLLYDNNIIVWGGDVRDREAWSASEKLQATTYPFVAFLALQPRRSPSGNANVQNNSPPTLTILSRHQGRPVPASGPTSAVSLVSQLERHVLPRVMPFLDVLKAAERERQMERRLREEQDRAYKESARRDKERIDAMMRKEREEAEKKRRQGEEARREEERRAKEEKERQKREEDRMIFRRWMRRKLLSCDRSREGEGPLRIAIRLPNGSRAVKRFKPDASLTTLYAFVDSQVIPPHMSEGDDPSNLPSESLNASLEACVESKLAHLSSGANEWWGFHIMNAYPRKEIAWAAKVRLDEVECLKGGGQVVVELLNLHNGLPASRERTDLGDDDDDGYDTEE